MTTIAPETAAGTELAPVSAARKALARKGRSFLDVVRAVHSAGSGPAPTQIEVADKVEPPLPAKPSVAEDVKVALRLVGERVAGIRVPTRRAKLSDAQFQSLGEALAAIKVVKKWIKEVEDDTIRVALFNHFDRVAEDGKDFDPEAISVDKNGFYVLPAQVKLDAGPVVKREPRQGRVTLAAEDLFELVQTGELDRQDYLALTKQVRVVDEEAVLGALERKPALAVAIKKASTVAPGSVALQVR